MPQDRRSGARPYLDTPGFDACLYPLRSHAYHHPTPQLATHPVTTRAHTRGGGDPLTARAYPPGNTPTNRHMFRTFGLVWVRVVIGAQGNPTWRGSHVGGLACVYRERCGRCALVGM